MEYLVVGLGNIGAEYANTRHNMGFMVLDAWAQASNVLFKTDRYGDVAEVSFKGRWFVLLKPNTYMNLSGNAVRYWMQKLHLPMENLIVISDDINLPFGTLRMRANGSSGGHNGLQDITDKLESDQWIRIRVGIGNEFSRGRQVDYVLGPLSDEEKAEVPQLATRIIQGIKDVSTIGVGRAMNTLNTRPKAEKAEKQENVADFFNFLQRFVFFCIYIIGLGFSTRQKNRFQGIAKDRFFCFLCPRMMLQDHSVPGGGVDVGVDFRGEDALVAQHFLDNT